MNMTIKPDLMFLISTTLMYKVSGIILNLDRDWIITYDNCKEDR